ncbi:hypothetical protein K1T71_003180 [Dendrolimus kikuchii]|uniref:Uncharacterized protein n=1 Tax=Dendrolimus kikuchii TaxID=765133 RepID=A0ACC1DB70_9NEOP|nr:hypothetical protein K1T71_003180 [Dendrolimus kikuchii]
MAAANYGLIGKPLLNWKSPICFYEVLHSSRFIYIWARFTTELIPRLNHKPHRKHVRWRYGVDVFTLHCKYVLNVINIEERLWIQKMICAEIKLLNDRKLFNPNLRSVRPIQVNFE